MTTAFSNRLREATVVIDAATERRYQDAVTAIASGKPSVADQIYRLRLAFGASAEHEELDDEFKSQLTAHEVELGPADRQLRRVLAACILIERFEHAHPRRTRSTATPDAIAALGARTLARAGWVPVHRDILPWAEYWLEATSRLQRSGGISTTSPSPELKAPGPNPDGTEPTPLAAVSALAGQLNEFAAQLSTWAGKLDPGGVAALREQLSLLWWLSSAHETVSPINTAISAARELAALAEWIPGPPNSGQLLTRRVGEARGTLVATPDIVDALADDSPIQGFEDMLPLISGTTLPPAANLPVETAALWIFDELVLRTLLQESA